MNLLKLYILLEIFSLSLLIIYKNSKDYEIIILTIIFNSLISLLYIVFIYKSYFLNEYSDIIYLVILLKCGLFPLNMLILKIYKNVNYENLLILTLYPKLFIIYIFINYNYIFLNNSVLIVYSILSIIVILWKEWDIKLLLGISSIINMSLLLLLWLTSENNNILLIFIVYYIINNISLFGLLYKNVNNTLLLVINIFSLIGLAPLIGFKLKYLLILMVWLNNNVLGWIILILSFLSSIIYLNLMYIFIYNINNTGYIIYSKSLSNRIWKISKNLSSISTINVNYYIIFVITFLNSWLFLF